MSAPYLGDYAEDTNPLAFLWSTNDRDGASITRATDGTVAVYKDGGTTQSTEGVTDTEDFDGVTGLHLCSIDLSAHAFYATGSDYTVVVTGAVIDGQTVNAPIAHFSIENRYMRGTDSANTTVPDAAGTAAGLHGTTDGLIGALNDIAAADVWTAYNNEVLYADLRRILGAALTSTSNQVADAFSAFFDVASLTFGLDTVLSAFKADVSALATAAALTNVLNLLESDFQIDTGETPWELVIKHKTTGTELLRKKLYQPDGTGVTAQTHVIGRHTNTDTE